MSTEENNVIDPTLLVTTDQTDYTPDSTATITAENVTVGGTIEFVVTDVDTSNGTVSGTNEVWAVTDGGAGDLDGEVNGTIVTSWYVGQDAANEAFVVSATETATGDTATASFTDAPSFDPVPASPTEANGTLFTTNDANAGTGVFPAFVQLQGQNNDTDDIPTTEQGFNSDSAPIEDSGNSSTFNHSIQVGDIPTEEIDGVTYFVFRLDLNEPNNGVVAGLATLNSLKLYSAADGDLTPAVGDLTAPAGATPLYDMDSSGDIQVVLADWNTGSGHGDYVVKIPVADYGDLSPDDYIYLFAEFSNAQGGFEEFALGPTTSPPPPPPPTPHAALSIDKDIVCIDIVDEEEVQHSIDGSVVQAGTDIRFTYAVTATEDAVSGVVIVDDNGTIGDTSDDLSTADDTIVQVLAADNVHNAGDADSDGVFDAGETWLYQSVIQTAVAGAYANDVVVNATSVQDGTPADAGIDIGEYFGVVPEIIVDKTTNGVDGLNVFQGQAITWTYDVSLGLNSNVSLANVVVTDDNGTPGNTADDFILTLDSGDTNGNGFLDAGETWHYVANGIAGATNYTNTATVTGDTLVGEQVFTADACGNSLVATDDDTSNYLVLTPSTTLTQGYWGAHATAWDGLANNNDKNIKISEVNPRTDGVLLGDLDHDGVADPGECTFFVSLAAAKAIESSSTTGDARIIMLQQAIAAQLNIYLNQTAANGGDPNLIGGAEPNDVITDAVKWLKTYGGQDNNDIVAGDFSVDKKNGITLEGSKVLTSSDAWNLPVDQTADSPWVALANGGSDVYATGEGLKNALMWWNQGELKTSSDGSVVGWFNDASTNQPNDHDMFWLTLHEVGGLQGIG